MAGRLVAAQHDRRNDNDDWRKIIFRNTNLLLALAIGGCAVGPNVTAPKAARPRCWPTLKAAKRYTAGHRPVAEPIDPTW
jgi:hypothetical protein